MFYTMSSTIWFIILETIAFSAILSVAKDIIKLKTKSKDKSPAPKTKDYLLKVGLLVFCVGCAVFCFYYWEKNAKTIASEQTYTVISTSREIENGCIDLTIQDENGVIAIVTYGMPDYPGLFSRFFNTSPPIINELSPCGDSNALILRKYKNGARETILEGMAGGELSAVLESYNLKMEVQ